MCKQRIIPPGIETNATAYDLVVEIEKARKIEPRKRNSFESDICNLAAFTEYKNDLKSGKRKPVTCYLIEYGVSTFPARSIVHPFIAKEEELTYADILEIKRLKNNRYMEQKKSKANSEQSDSNEILLSKATEAELIAQLRSLGQYKISRIQEIEL